MWRTEGDFTEQHQKWGQDTQSIKYYCEPKQDAPVTEVLLDVVRADSGHFFRIEITCANEDIHQRLISQLIHTKPKLSFKTVSFSELFFTSPQVPELMRFMDVVACIAPNVSVLKDKIKAECEKVTAALLPKAITPALALSSDKPFFADLQPQLSIRKLSFQ